MNWTTLDSADQLASIKQAQGYSVIFKHSTRCPISAMAKRKFELDLDRFPGEIPLYFLDLIKYREVSNKIVEDFSIHHESPQMLLIKDGECILDQSHGEIDVDDTLLMIE